ncbi:MAG: flagellar protein FlgN [Clostridiales bacterium]|nr:flagellar protein FlgN [Clostridiales bacterium]
MEAVQIASEELCANMTKALGLIGELTEISGEKEALLEAGDIEGLRSMTEKEEEIIAALNRTEKDRKNCADALSQAIGIFQSEITLNDIIEKLSESTMRERLSELRNSLLDAAENLSRLNDRLGQQLQLRIGFTDYMINLLYVPKKRNHTYDIQGSKKDEAGDMNLLDLHI